MILQCLMTITPDSNGMMNLFAASIFKESSLAPIILMIFFGVTNPSSSARIDRWKYRSCASDGMSRKSSLSMTDLANILLSAIQASLMLTMSSTMSRILL